MLVRAATACARLRSYLDGVTGAVVVDGVQKMENIYGDELVEQLEHNKCSQRKRCIPQLTRLKMQEHHRQASVD
jgi:hypothetical protein